MLSCQVLAHQQIFRPGARFPECHASTLALLPGGGIAAAWFGGSHEKHPDTAIWFSRRSGGVWSAPIVAADTPGTACWNPVLCYNGERLLLFFKSGPDVPRWRTMLSVSGDNGDNWTPPRELVPGDVGGRGPVKNKCIRLADGALLAPASVETPERWDCFTDRSEDNGFTWTPSPTVPLRRDTLRGRGIIQPALWQDAGGDVWMLARSTDAFLYRARSSDGGRSWGAAEPTDIPNNNSGIDLARLPDGRLALVYNPVGADWGARTPICLSVSGDNGATWSQPYVLEHDPFFDKNTRKTPVSGPALPEPFAAAPKGGEFSYPAVIAAIGGDGDGSGGVYLTYTWNRVSVAFWHISL